MLKLAAAAILLVPVLASAQGDAPMPDGPGKAIIQKSCVACHSIKVITAKRADADEWNSTVQMMVSRGADLTDVTNLTREQLATAIIDDQTKLPILADNPAPAK